MLALLSCKRQIAVSLFSTKAEPRLWCGSPFPDGQLGGGHAGRVPALQGIPQEVPPSGDGPGLANERGGGPVR